MQRLRKKLRRFRIENDGIRSFWKHWTIPDFIEKHFTRLISIVIFFLNSSNSIIYENNENMENGEFLAKICGENG